MIMAPMKRKSQGSIRSPHVKRNIQSQVNLEGWIYKLEGGALKQWKQRWCVLADFCLFFYKAPREEKVTSSILLPSYKINPCSTVDKVSKKYAFKAEHHNMKTYYFAAEDKESMKKWMNAMSLASIMQKFVSSEMMCNDDDSGFTSYRSRRHSSNRSSSVHNAHTDSEPLKQRSNSCGDRVGEMYLGSDDKYPNVYKNTSSQLCNASSSQMKIAMRQPLYANAPPKPRRLTQTDGCAFYANDNEDSEEPDLVLDTSQYSLDNSVQKSYLNQNNTMQYLPTDPEAKMSIYVHSNSSPVDNDLTHCPDSERNIIKPSRPHSADFLEREGDCVLPSYTFQYSETPQLQRPKSSLECYSHNIDVEEYDFDDYREAVRIQADNLYANKRCSRNRNMMEKQKQLENVMRSDSKLNAHYVNHSPYSFGDSVLHAQIRNAPDVQTLPDIANSHHRGYNDSQNSKIGQNESMQRLLEWKQRMLQSPLSRRNQLQSTSSECSSVNSSKPIEGHSNYEMYQQATYMSRCQDKFSPYQDLKHSNIPTENPAYNNSKQSPPHCNINDGLPYQTKDTSDGKGMFSEDSDVSHQNATTVDLANTFHKSSNIMYCVDSENNEILFSYGSPSHSNISTTLHSSRYPPQMHSFSTLPNVNDIGIEPTTSDHHVRQSVRSRYHRHEMNKLKKAGIEKEVAYTSDDEDDVIEDFNLMETSVAQSELHQEEKYFDERNGSASPDYVNIGCVYRELDSTQEMYPFDSLFKQTVEVNKAVLKQLDQVSKNRDSFPENKKPSAVVTMPCTSTNQYLNDAYQNQSYSKEKSFSKSKLEAKERNESSTDFIDDMECDIKREDYYRASQLFYSSMRMRSKIEISPQKVVTVSNSFEDAIEYSQHKPDMQLVKNIAAIDKDVGIPLPVTKIGSSKSKFPATNLKDSICHETMNNFMENSHKEFKNVTLIDPISMKNDKEMNNSEIPNDKKNTKQNLTYEELRGQLLRKREAPPPNIVQERIKKFETVEKVKNKIIKPSISNSKLIDNNLHATKYVNRSFSKRNRLKINHSRSHKRNLHSDSEAINFDDSDASSDDLTMKSAPILLSPLSSVLADLRKTADSGKEKAKDITRDQSPIRKDKTNIEFSKSTLLSNNVKKDTLMYDSQFDPCTGFLQNEDSVYIPMYGIKAIIEPEYVTMGNSKCSLSGNDSAKKYCEEHVYNEPFSAPSSFLHDVYGKQKSNQFHYQVESSSSDESLTENIYEKPMQRFSFENSKDEHMTKSAQETNFVLMNSLSCSNVTTFGQSDTENKKSFSKLKNKHHHYEQMHLSVSVPDLLQLQEIKDSDASDADDEASRDFDVTGCASVSSYQEKVHDHLDITNINHYIQPDDNSRLHSKTLSYVSKKPYIESYQLCSDAFQEKEKSTPQMTCIPSSYETISKTNSNTDALIALLESKSETSKIDVSDGERKIHVRKLRVYTKGKKPEAPKIFPVPFNLEESEVNKIAETKPLKALVYDRSSTQTHDLPLSDNVAYMSRAELSSFKDPVVHSDIPISHPSSYAPDIISSIKEEEKSHSECSSPFSKSPNSAPYYYSDLYSGHGINFSGQCPFFKQYDAPMMEKMSSPKSCTSLLNNIRPKSPSTNKTDIGRKVNNINRELRDKQVFCEKPVLKYLNEDETKNNLKHSLDVFQVSESKYLDAEKNKYEAGSTLEKTRPSHTMSSIKYRASTPDLNKCQYHSDEPVYENLVFQSQRVSLSLEDIPASLELLDDKINGSLKSDVTPVYENIEFFNEIDTNRIVEKSFFNCNKDLSSWKSSPKINENASDMTDSFVCDEKYSSKTRKYLQNKDTSCIISQSNDQEVNFLDQDMLRRVSQRHFYPLRKQFCFNKPSDIHAKNSMANCKIFSNNEDFIYQIQPLTEISLSKGSLNGKMNDSVSSSDTTSSGDEASIDSDYRQRHTVGKFFYEDRHNSIPELTFKEAKYLKKLVHQSHGLMNKGKQLSVSAGDLLGKTHEELVLLLIQLRRNQSKILKAKEKLENKLRYDKDNVQPIQHQSTSQPYEELCQQISHLEKQYEVTQPLVTLVDNMVKLGSLYGSSNRRSFSLPSLDCAGEETSSSLSSHLVSQQTSILSNLLNKETDLQKHINEINNLEKGLQSETNSISSLHQDKEMLEHTLCGMKNKILDHQDRPAELQKLRKQQRMIEKELTRVKRLLSTSAKKIEDAASKNDQMEKEILHLRQILQQALKTGSSESKSSQHNRANLEAELTRLQSVLDELANHRHEINNTVEKLKSEACSSRPKGAEVRASPTGVAGSAPLPLRKKQHSMYFETDLDTMITRDLAVMYERDLDDIPVYANAEEITLSNEDVNFNEMEQISENLKSSSSQVDGPDSEFCSLQDINEADERMKRFYGILPKEKPSEIKTVRIVKRQSERRNRERDKKKVSYDEQSSIWIMEEPDLSSDDYLEVDESNHKKASSQMNRPSSINLIGGSGNRQSNSQSAHERLFGSSTTVRQGTFPRVQITKKIKRRHYTVSGYQYLLDPQFSQYFTERPRSRDDVDMERCLRTANTPDIVRSTIKKKEVFDDNFIERELGLPQKIDIPERYVEIEPEQLSAKEKLQRSLKAENICKMLSETTTPYGDVQKRSSSPDALHKKLNEEKRKRAQLLSLNQALAREVVERSKAVAANVYPLENEAAS